MPKKHFRPTVLEFLNTAFLNCTNGGWLPSLHLRLLRLGLCLFPHLSTTQLTSPPFFPHPQPVNTHLVHSPTLTPYSIPHLPQHMGANPGRMRVASPPRIRQHSPNTFNVQVAYRYSKLGISKRDDFFWFLLHFGQKTGHQQT